MSKRLTHEMTYDAPLADVRAMLFDPAFREEVCAYQQVKSADVTIGPGTAGTTDVRIDQVQKATGIPSFATKFVGETIQIVQTETWDAAGRGTINVDIPGKPGEMAGTAVLTEAGGVTTETVEMTVKVGVPLIGGKLEGLVVDLLLRALKAENKVGRDYLSR